MSTGQSLFSRRQLLIGSLQVGVGVAAGLGVLACAPSAAPAATQAPAPAAATQAPGATAAVAKPATQASPVRQTRGKVIFVTHDPRIAAHTRRIIRISDGRIVGDEPVDDPVIACPDEPLPVM